MLNCFHSARVFSPGAVEGMNGKAKVALGRAYGCRSGKSCELARYHALRFPNDHAAAKLIDLALMRVQCRWRGQPTYWGLARNEFAIRFGKRLPRGRP